MDPYLLLYWDLIQECGRLNMETYKYRNLLENLLDMTIFQNNATKLKIFFSDGDMTSDALPILRSKSTRILEF